MNNIESILYTSFIFILAITGLFFVVSSVTYSPSTNLDNESENILLVYKNVNSQINNSEIFSSWNETQADNQGVDAFYRSISEAKTTSEKFKDSTTSILKFPAALIASIPFVPTESVQYIVNLFVGLIAILLFIAIFKIWFGGGNTNN